ncbi:serine/threonine-protein kinase [Streptomyces cyaneofuscatus]|uniref:serine/threonine-protein kinase n=1 Tax=Streptomyces cyaneofuscatus TaxID=66883 RepID=UPI0033348256
MEGLTAEDPSGIGPYRLFARLGEGGMGRVYLARSPGGDTVAVKLVRREIAAQDEFRRRFTREVRAARRVGGRWTASVLDADVAAEVPWLATEYVPGPTLRDVVKGDFGPLPSASAHVLGHRMGLALAAIHAAGLVHRDLKPSNILLTTDGPRVIDFGIAHALDGTHDGSLGSTLTPMGSMIGSPEFMSPEQVRGEQVSPASDVFSVGCVLVYAATGRSPFRGDGTGLHSLLFRIAYEDPDLEGVPEAIVDLARDCLAKEAPERPSVAELIDRTRYAPSGAWLPQHLLARLDRTAAQLIQEERRFAVMAVLKTGRPAAPLPRSPLSGSPLPRSPLPSPSRTSPPRTVTLSDLPGAPGSARVAVRRELLDLPESGIVPPVIRYRTGPVPLHGAMRDTDTSPLRRRPLRARVVTAFVCLSLLVAPAADARHAPSPFVGTWQYLPQTQGARLPYALHLEFTLSGPSLKGSARLFVASEDGYCHGSAFAARHAGDDTLVLTDMEIKTSSSGGHGEATTTGCAWPEILTVRAGSAAEGRPLSVRGPAGYLPLARTEGDAQHLPDEFIGIWRSGDTRRVTFAQPVAGGPAVELSETTDGGHCTWRAAYLGNRAGEIATGPGMLESWSDKSCTTDGRAYTYRFTDASRRILERRLTDGSEPVRFTLGS